MSSKHSQTKLPASLRRAQSSFRRWRQRRRPGSRIPAQLWEAAVRMAGEFGISPTAAALGLDYHSLKKRVERQADDRPPGSDGPKEAVFLELTATATPPPAGELLVEWEDAAGAKMRVRLQGCSVPDLDALSRSFWGRNP